MKKLLFLLLLIPFWGNSQATFTAPVGYNTGAPTATPSGVGTRWRFDLLTGKKYTWLPGTLSWDEDARGIDQVAGCSAPLYTPGYNQSTFAINSCTPPVLYQWTGAAWEIPNEPEVYTAGTGISIDGSNVITNTAPNVVQTLSIAGQDLTLSNGGGTVAIPGGSSLGTGFTAGGGMGAIPAGTSSTTVLTGDWNTRTLFGVPSKYEENVGDGFNCFGIESYNETDNDYWFIGNTDDDPGSLTFFRNKVGSFLGSFGISSSGVFLTSDLNARFEGGFGGFNMTAAGHTFIDKNASELGIEYADDYSATIAANPRSIPDVGTVEQIIAAENGALGTGFTAGGGTGTVPDVTTMQLETGGSFGSRQVRMLFGKPNYYQEVYADGFPAFGMDDYDSDENVIAFFGFQGDAAGSFSFASYDLDDPTNNSDLSASPGFFTLAAKNINLSMPFTTGEGIKVFDDRATPLGIRYAADYSATISANPRSIPDVGTVDLLKQTPVSYDNASAPNNCIFYSTTLSKLAYKDPGGTVNPLY